MTDILYARVPGKPPFWLRPPEPENERRAEWQWREQWELCKLPTAAPPTTTRDEKE